MSNERMRDGTLFDSQAFEAYLNPVDTNSPWTNRYTLSAQRTIQSLGVFRPYL